MRILRFIAAVFVVVYGGIFLATFADPVLLERQAEDYLRERLKTEVHERVGSLKEQTTSGLAQVLARHNVKAIEALEADLNDGLDERLDAIMSMMRNPTCECRRYLEQKMQESIGGRIAELRTQTDVLQRIAMEAYGAIVRNLQRDFRIFSGISLLAFMLIIVVSYLKPQAHVHLVLPSGLLGVSTLIASWLYLFKQNWFFTILTNSYVGLWYLLWIALIFSFLLDITINRGRITTKIINAAGNSLSGAFSAVPC